MHPANTQSTAILSIQSPGFPVSELARAEAPLSRQVCSYISINVPPSLCATMPKLVLRNGDGAPHLPTVIELRLDATRLGRSRGQCDVVIGDAGVVKAVSRWVLTVCSAIFLRDRSCASSHHRRQTSRNRASRAAGAVAHCGQQQHEWPVPERHSH